MNYPVAMTLKQLRELKGYTQEETAKKIGVSKDILGNYERGKSYLDVPIIRQIEKVYDIQFDRIIFLPLHYDNTVNSV
ncbi:MAG: helix-turn-helix transcriptional regulator [Clostridium sp.]|nr:helix-turn-helix transcriptional regulator [Clostridium sp.]